MLTAFSESDLQALVSAASQASINMSLAYNANKTGLKQLFPDILTLGNWFVGDNETSVILASYNEWKSPSVIAMIERNIPSPPSWVFPYYWFHSPSFRIYGTRLKRLNEMATKLLSVYPMYEVNGALRAYIALYKQFQDNNPAEPEKPAVEKALKEAWDKMSPILKWGAIGIAAIFALSGFTKEKK